jgi:hypothetical protein
MIHLLNPCVNDCRDDLVLRLEVVIDVADGYFGCISDLGQRGALDALLMQELHCGTYEALSLTGSFAGTILGGGVM